MLSQSIKRLSLEDKVNGVHDALLKIGCTSTMKHVRSLIYTKTEYHKVKCISFDMSCCITHRHRDVASAIIKMSSVIFALQHYVTLQKDAKVHALLHHIREIYHYMKEGLREYGCTRPLFRTGTCLKENDVLLSAKTICETWLQAT